MNAAPASTEHGAQAVDTAARLARVMAAIDAANAEDPNGTGVGGERRPSELVYGERMTATLARMHPEASECLRIAARGQHVGRWRLPRARYAPGRAGYLAWRKHQRRLQSERLAGIMAAHGYGPAEIACVGRLIRKERLGRDPQTQALEDVICVVFLEHHLADFAARSDGHKLADILAKTWNRMSEDGHRHALQLDWPPGVRELLHQGLARLRPAGGAASEAASSAAAVECQRRSPPA